MPSFILVMTMMNLQSFEKIKQICVVNSNVNKAMFVVSKKDTLMFDEHYQAYKIAAPIQEYAKVFYAQDFTCHLPLNEIKPFRCQAKYVCLRYEIELQ